MYYLCLCIICVLRNHKLAFAWCKSSLNVHACGTDKSCRSQSCVHCKRLHTSLPARNIRLIILYDRFTANYDSHNDGRSLPYPVNMPYHLHSIRIALSRATWNMNAEILVGETNGEYDTRIVVIGECGVVVNGNTFSMITGLLISFWPSFCLLSVEFP